MESGIKGLIAVPFIMIKVLVLVVALSYWDFAMCRSIEGFGWGVFIILAGATFGEAARALKTVVIDSGHFGNLDDIVVVTTLLVSIVFPAVLLFFAARVLLLDECVGI